jgi:glycosyltransferase involved in cell wall biosynthesis
MTVLYLYAELMGYNIPVIKELTSTYKAVVHVVHWDKNKLTPYIAPKIPGVTYYNRSDFESVDLIELAKQICPDIVYVPNWYDKGYLPVCKLLRKKGIPVVAGLDNQWIGNLKQWMGCIYMRLHLKKYFSHIWVAGPSQYEFARRLGFHKNHIIFDFYSADVDKFSSIRKAVETIHNPKKFLFVGRLEPVKGIDLLLKAWKEIKDKKGWDITLIGNGSLKSQLEGHSGVTLKDFMQPDDLVQEIKNYGCFILPSTYEPYGVVLHEFAVAGMPIIVSDACGGAPVFVVNGYSGYQFKSGNYLDLIGKIEKIIRLDTDQFNQMSLNAHKQGIKITPQTSAAQFMSVLN